MTVIYDKGNSHCQICHFGVIGDLRKALLSRGYSCHAATKNSADVTPDMNLRNPLHTSYEAC